MFQTYEFEIILTGMIRAMGDVLLKHLDSVTHSGVGIFISKHLSRQIYFSILTGRKNAVYSPLESETVKIS